MARSVTALSRRRPEDGSPGPCPPTPVWGFSLRLKSETFRYGPILGCASDLYLPQLGNPAVTEYKITVARIETAARGAQGKEICVTFQVDRAPISFQIPIFLNIHDFDDTEMVQVARNILHRTFMQLAAESRDWKLTTAELQRLSKLNLRPTKRPA
jgi:hypothetical protein